MPEWKKRYPGVEALNVAVMGCIVNGPGESKHADIGISLPGTGETPTAPVFIDGKKAVTLRGPTVAADFKKMVIDYIERRFGAGGREDGGGVTRSRACRRSDCNFYSDRWRVDICSARRSRRSRDHFRRRCRRTGRFKAVRLVVQRQTLPAYCEASVSIYLAAYPDSFAETEKSYTVYAAPCPTPADPASLPSVNRSPTTPCRSPISPARRQASITNCAGAWWMLRERYG